MAAAVADYRPAQVQAGKRERGGAWSLELEPTADVLAALAARRRPGQVLVGFAAEDGADIERAEAKRLRKGVDLIVLNDVSRSDIGFDVDHNEVVLVGRRRRRARAARSQARDRGAPCSTASSNCSRPDSSWGKSPARRTMSAMEAALAEPQRLERARDAALRVIANVRRAVSGEPAVVERAVVALLAEGHVLVEDVPGVGKTTLARALARSLDCSFARIQFTPDVLPSDVTGVSVFDQRTSEFAFRPGPVFANVVLADELNRASPRTQSALLECMQERQVTVDGVARPLAAPFFVIATQNPIEQDGTFPLPEAQLDRFALRLALGYPEPGAEARMLADQTAPEGSPLETLAAVADAAELRGRRARLPHACTSRPRCTPTSSRSAARPARIARLALGASPRAGVTLVRLARAHALVQRARPRAARRRQGARARRARPPAAAGAGRAGGRRLGARTSCSRGCPSRCERGGGPGADRARVGCTADAVSLRSSSRGCSARRRSRCSGRRSWRRCCSRACGSAARAGRTSPCARCRRSRMPARACGSRSSCARSRARAAGAAAFREAGGGPVCALRPVSAGGLRVLRGSYELGPLERGVLELGAGELVREDPFGLARRVDATRGSTALTVVAPPLELPEGRARPRRRRARRGRGCAAAATSCTACASTSRASRCAACTGPRPRITGG